MPTVIHRLARWAEETPDAPAQRYKSGGQWKTITAREFRDRVYHLALFFKTSGELTSNDVGAVLSYNSPQWVQTELATLLAGAKSAGLYPNSTAKDIHYVLGHTQCKVLSVQNREYFEKITVDGRTLPDHVKTVIVLEGDTSFTQNTVSYEAALAKGAKLAEKASGELEFAGRALAVRPSGLRCRYGCAR